MSKNNIASLLSTADRIAIIAHRKGDGDSFGSMIALKLGLEKIGKKITLISESGLPAYLGFLGDFSDENFNSFLPNDTQILLVIDCSEEQITSFPNIVIEARNRNVSVVQIDHHVPGALSKTADISWVGEGCCATAEMVYQLILEMKIELDKGIATALMAGIEGDTNSFQNQNTSESCMMAAAELISKGARLNRIVKSSGTDRDVATLKLWGLVVNRLKVNKDNVAITFLSYKDALDLGLEKSDFGPVTNFLNSIKGVKMLFIITEEKNGLIKVSMRTRDEDVDVAKIAKCFGGGGHVKAAGFTFKGHFDIQNNLLRIV